MRLAGRSPRELAFRLQQQIANLAIWAIPPHLGSKRAAVELPLPPGKKVAAGLKGTPFAAEIQTLAQGILSRGSAVEWRRDYANGKVSGATYFRFIPYLDFEKVGDHKNIWEPNRHQHLVTFAQAHLLEPDPAYLNEISAQLDSWWSQNPFLKGINWASALEVAFRSLSWLWLDHLAGHALDPGVRRRLWNSLYQHAAYLERNLSVYFSPNTHLLGEAVALHAIGLKFGVAKWVALGARIAREELEHQVASDGSHFEQSTYYHVYALDFFVLHYLLSGRPPGYRSKLRKMAHFLSAIVGTSRLLTCFGDDDGGRLFHPYGPRDQFARATLATCAALFPEDRLPFQPEDIPIQAAWWLGTSSATAGVAAIPETCVFPDSGLVTIARGELQVIIDSGPFGDGGAGHSHADALSLTVRRGDRDVLIDPGTYTYVADAKLRDDFRGTGFHNTIRVDRMSQADPAGPFRWEQKPSARRLNWSDKNGVAFLDAVCGYRGLRHRRRILLMDEELLLVLDEIRCSGANEQHSIEQFWHLGDAPPAILFSDPGAVREEQGMRSRVLGEKEPARVLCAAWDTKLPHYCAAAIFLGDAPAGAILELKGLELCIPGVISVSYSDSAMPTISRP